MSKIRLEPANDHVLVADNPVSTVIDGIEMPDAVRQQEMLFGVVVAKGPLALSTEPGNRVCYGPYAGKTIVLNGHELRLLREGQIESYVREDAE
jgi:co-chaperonin GroES (HSP10)